MTSRSRAVVYVVAWSLVAQAAGVVAREQANESSTSQAIRHLHSADRLARGGLTEFAAEHLLEIDPTALPEEYLLAYAGLIVIAVEKLSFVDESLQELARANLEDERLRPLAHTWRAWAVLSIKDRRVSTALEAWDRSLRQEESRDRRLATLRRALGHLARVVVSDGRYIEYDPGVQAGAFASASAVGGGSAGPRLEP